MANLLCSGQVTWLEGALQMPIRKFRLEAHQSLARVAISKRQSWVGDQVREPVCSAEETSVSVVLEPLLCALHGGLEGQSRRATLLVLRKRGSNQMTQEVCQHHAYRYHDGRQVTLPDTDIPHLWSIRHNVTWQPLYAVSRYSNLHCEASKCGNIAQGALQKAGHAFRAMHAKLP